MNKPPLGLEPLCAGCQKKLHTCSGLPSCHGTIPCFNVRYAGEQDWVEVCAATGAEAAAMFRNATGQVGDRVEVDGEHRPHLFVLFTGGWEDETTEPYFTG